MCGWSPPEADVGAYRIPFFLLSLSFFLSFFLSLSLSLSLSFTYESRRVATPFPTPFIDRHRVDRVSTGFNGFQRVSTGFNGFSFFYLVSLSFPLDDSVLPVFYLVAIDNICLLPRFTEFYWVLLGFNGFYLVLPSFTGFLGLIGFELGPT